MKTYLVRLQIMEFGGDGRENGESIVLEGGAADAHLRNDSHFDPRAHEEGKRPLVGNGSRRIQILPARKPNGFHGPVGPTPVPANLSDPGSPPRMPSIKSLANCEEALSPHLYPMNHGVLMSPVPSNINGVYGLAEAKSQMSVRSTVSIGMGSSDGRKVTIRRVPTSPSELLNIINPPT